jgi:hypothetical protein
MPPADSAPASLRRLRVFSALRSLAIASVLLGAFAGCAAGLHLEAAGPSHAPAIFRDPDLEAEVALVEIPQTSGQVDSPSSALALELHNRSATPIELRSSGLILIGPDHRMVPQAIGHGIERLAPGGRASLRLPPLSRPLRPGDAIELVLPTVVRSIPREYHFRIRVRRGRPSQ